MATKRELISEIVKAHQSYLGFGIEGVSGLNSRTKTQLTAHLQQMKRAVAWKNYARKVEDRLKARLGEQAILAIAISGVKDTDYEIMHHALKKASEYRNKASIN